MTRRIIAYEIEVESDDDDIAAQIGLIMDPTDSADMLKGSFPGAKARCREVTGLYRLIEQAAAYADDLPKFALDVTIARLGTMLAGDIP